jgi:glutamyl/glutaminyl-tRNA synthetase
MDTCTSATPSPSASISASASEFGGLCNLRFDDTNPTKEDVEYVDAIQEDVRWLGFEWASMFYASDYFELLYQYAEELIRQEKAYVDSLSADDIRTYRARSPSRGATAPTDNVPSRRTSTCSAGCGAASSRTAHTCCGR